MRRKRQVFKVKPQEAGEILLVNSNKGMTRQRGQNLPSGKATSRFKLLRLPAKGRHSRISPLVYDASAFLERYSQHFLADVVVRYARN